MLKKHQIFKTAQNTFKIIHFWQRENKASEEQWQRMEGWTQEIMGRCRPGDEGWTVRRPGAEDMTEENRLNRGYGRVRTTGSFTEGKRECFYYF